MTEESCVTYCNGLSYIYAGVEYAQQCCKSYFAPIFKTNPVSIFHENQCKWLILLAVCGNSFTGNVSEPSTDCDMACTGNANEPCGGPNRLNIFWSGATPPPPPETDPGPPGWSFIGCYEYAYHLSSQTSYLALSHNAESLIATSLSARVYSAPQYLHRKIRSSIWLFPRLISIAANGFNYPHVTTRLLLS